MASRYKFNIETLSDSCKAAWDELVDRSNEGTAFANSSYLDALEIKSEIATIETGREIVAGMLLPANKLGLRSNPILVKHLGLIFSPEMKRKQRRAIAEITAQECCVFPTFDYNFSMGFDDWLPFYWQGFRQTTKYTYRIAPDARNDWRGKLAGNTRNDIAHAERCGISINDTNNSANLVELVARTFERRGAKSPLPRPKLGRFIDRLLEQNRASVKEALDPQQGCVAALCVAKDRQTDFLILSGFKEVAARGTTSLLIAKAIEQCLVSGRTFDFEGSMIKPIEKFYAGFGGSLSPYHRIYNASFLNSAKEFVVPIAKRLRLCRGGRKPPQAARFARSAPAPR